MRILVVEDELVSREKLRKIASTFAECRAVATGGEALEAFSEAWESIEPFDLICLDIQLPDLDGIETLRHIRDLEEETGVGADARVKVVMVTAHSDTQRVAQAIEAGCDDYMLKPVTKGKLVEKVEHLFRDPLIPHRKIIKED